MHFYIRNMVCDRCKLMVKAEFDKLGFNALQVELGQVEVEESEIDEGRLAKLDQNLHLLGFELISDKKKQLVVKIKALVVNLVHYSEKSINVNLSTYLSEQLQLNYAYLSTIFSEAEHDTIEKFFIRQKIEKAKELLAYGEQSLSEIAYYLNYSSVAHLSAQFKKVTHQTASSYRKNATARLTLDRV